MENANLLTDPRLRLSQVLDGALGDLEHRVEQKGDRVNMLAWLIAACPQDRARGGCEVCLAGAAIATHLEGVELPATEAEQHRMLRAVCRHSRTAGSRIFALNLLRSGKVYEAFMAHGEPIAAQMSCGDGASVVRIPANVEFAEGKKVAMRRFVKYMRDNVLPVVRGIEDRVYGTLAEVAARGAVDLQAALDEAKQPVGHLS